MDAAPAAAALLAPEMGWTKMELKEQATRFTESYEEELLAAGLESP
jgi:hypothetical protein